MKLTEIVKRQHPKYAAKTEIQPYMFQTKEEIEQWMKKLVIDGMVSKELTIHATGSSSIDLARFGNKKEDVLIQHDGKWVLPVQFHLAGTFDVTELEIESCVGFPYVIMNELRMKNSKIKDFEDMPKVVPTIYGSSSIRMESFKGLDETNCTSLEWSCLAGIDSLEGLPRNLTKFSGNIVDSTLDIKELVTRCPNLEQIIIGGDSLILKNILSIFRLKNLNYVYFRPGEADETEASRAHAIFIKHIKGDRNAIACQKELYDNNLDVFAD
jgi:hypothetical protein